MTELHDALEKCLESMQRGASLESALKRYPDLASELRPLLDASLMARSAARVHVPLDVRRRGRSKYQRRLSDMETSGRTARRLLPVFPRLAITAILVAALALTSTGLVSASSASLPGQQLYPVKRGWESLRLLFVFNPQQRDLMESSYEQERLDEISELLGRRMAAPIAFSGILAQQSNGQWVVSGIPVSVSGSTSLPTTQVADGVPITVSGVTRPDGVVEAHQILVLQPGSSLPPLEPSENGGEAPGQNDEGDSSATRAAPTAAPTSRPASPGSTPDHISYQFTGVIQSIQGTTWNINGQTVHVDSADISGQPTVGSIVRFRGYYNDDGSLTVTTVEPQSSGVDSAKHGTGGGQPSGGEGEGGGSGGEGEGP